MSRRRQILSGAEPTPAIVMQDRAGLSIAEAAGIAGISRSQAYILIGHGLLPILKIGRRTLVQRCDIDRMLRDIAALPAEQQLALGRASSPAPKPPEKKRSRQRVP